MPRLKMDAFVSLTIFVLISNVASWTIDLPEIRRYYFDKHSEPKVVRVDDESIRVDRERLLNTNNRENFNNRIVDRIPYDNIDVNSPLNTDYKYRNRDIYEDDDDNDVHYGSNYADDYEYHTYMEKKVHEIVHKGSAYLEGLSQALEQYGDLLESCRRFNFTNNFNVTGFNITAFNFNMTGFNSSRFNETFLTNANGFNFSSPFMMQNSTWLPQNEAYAYRNASANDTLCDRVTRYSEYVRRLAALALWSTRELQDRTYNDRYDKYEELSHDEEEEEKELLLRLAWFLERLAKLTGYDPPVRRGTTSTPAPVVSVTPLTLVPFVPKSVEIMLQNCLKEKSPLPADVRCRIPDGLTDQLNAFFNFSSQESTTLQPSELSVMEIPTAQESRLSEVLLPKTIKKRSIDTDPFLNVVKYYTKTKIWESANPNSDVSAKSEEFHVKNDLPVVKDNPVVKSVEKRSANHAIHPIHPIHPHPIHLSEDHIWETRYVEHADHEDHHHHSPIEDKVEKIKSALHKIKKGVHYIARKYVEKLDKHAKHVHKRSVESDSKIDPNAETQPQNIYEYLAQNRGPYNYQGQLETPDLVSPYTGYANEDQLQDRRKSKGYNVKHQRDEARKNAYDDSKERDTYGHQEPKRPGYTKHNENNDYKDKSHEREHQKNDARNRFLPESPISAHHDKYDDDYKGKSQDHERNGKKNDVRKKPKIDPHNPFPYASKYRDPYLYRGQPETPRYSNPYEYQDDYKENSYERNQPKTDTIKSIIDDNPYLPKVDAYQDNYKGKSQEHERNRQSYSRVKSRIDPVRIVNPSHEEYQDDYKGKGLNYDPKNHNDDARKKSFEVGYQEDNKEKNLNHERSQYKNDERIKSKTEPYSQFPYVPRHPELHGYRKGHSHRDRIEDYIQSNLFKHKNEDHDGKHLYNDWREKSNNFPYVSRDHNSYGHKDEIDISEFLDQYKDGVKTKNLGDDKYDRADVEKPIPVSYFGEKEVVDDKYHREDVKNPSTPISYLGEKEIGDDKYNRKDVKKPSKPISYFGKKERPRVSDDPQKDISFYVKNKKGTNIRPNLQEAILLRAGLEQIFQNGNIEVVRRFGANVNPLNPNPFFFGVFRTASDVV